MTRRLTARRGSGPYDRGAETYDLIRELNVTIEGYRLEALAQRLPLGIVRERPLLTRPCPSTSSSSPIPRARSRPRPSPSGSGFLRDGAHAGLTGAAGYQPAGADGYWTLGG